METVNDDFGACAPAPAISPDMRKYVPKDICPACSFSGLHHRTIIKDQGVEVKYHCALCGYKLSDTHGKRG